MTTFGYIFISVDSDHVESLGDQQRVISEYVAGSKLAKVDDIVIEQHVPITRPFSSRPEGRKLLERVQAGDSLIVSKSSWVFGSAKEGGRFLKELGMQGIYLHCVDLGQNITMPSERKLIVSDGNVDLIKNLLAALAVCESSRHGEAIKATKRARKREGKYLGGPVPFGWSVGSEGVLEMDEEQQRVIAEVKMLRVDRKSYRQIAVILAERYGLDLSHEGIRRILESDRRRKEMISRQAHKDKIRL